jgi:hypothetical protein
MESTNNKYYFYRVQHQSENRWNYFMNSVIMYVKRNSTK